MAAVTPVGVLDEVVALADEHAEAFLREIGRDDPFLRSALAGMLLSFLSEAALVASSLA